jgi:CO/xanthine dehydrogenase Mo-binding subunit
MKPDQDNLTTAVTRRDFMQLLGAGLMIAVSAEQADAQAAPPRQGRGPRGGGRPTNVSARVHIGKDGIVTVMTGKVECGQGSRAEITQAAAEELRLPAERILLIMADTSLVPDDGSTAGSGTTPRTIPAVRQGTAAARELLIGLAAKRWNTEASGLEARDGKVLDKNGGRELTYADLALAPDSAGVFDKTGPGNVTLTPVKEWKVLGKASPRPNGRDLVNGGHHFPSDIIRPGMLYGKILRAPTYGSTLTTVDLAPAKVMKNVVVVQDGSFVGIAASTTFAAEAALDAISATAKWTASTQIASKDLYDHLKKRARGGVPANPFADDFTKAATSLEQTYHVAYAQHAPMEPRVAVAEWEDGKLTVWTATQNPFGVKGELERAFNLTADQVRVIVPDFGGGFGGKHSGECAVETARLAKAAGKPVRLRWTRGEEFTFAYFRPAGVIEARAGLDEKGTLTSWHFVNINSGPSSVETPYRAGKSRSQFVQSDPPLKHGSYRGLAATANTFGRECFMDELAALAGQDALEFRLAHLDNARLRAVLEDAAKRFDWLSRVKKKEPDIGVGLACGTEKGSFVATCAEVMIDRANDRIAVRHISQTFECGAVLNPGNLMAQNQGAIVMALGPALREEIRFEGGKMLTDAFSDYLVPRFADVPTIDVHLLDRPDLPSAGAGETPLISVAPAIANAIFNATGTRVREMPMRIPKA